jgi:hypothetical protein
MVGNREEFAFGDFAQQQIRDSGKNLVALDVPI